MLGKHPPAKSSASGDCHGHAGLGQYTTPQDFLAGSTPALVIYSCLGDSMNIILNLHFTVLKIEQFPVRETKYNCLHTRGNASVKCYSCVV